MNLAEMLVKTAVCGSSKMCRYISSVSAISSCFIWSLQKPIAKPAVTTLPPKRRISLAKPLHLFRESVASLRESVIPAFSFNGLRDPPVLIL
jgi:hypothetical protein